jgi:hypothetical protein
MKRVLTSVLAMLLMSMSFTSCSHIDNKRIPAMAVNIVFSNVGVWNTYGVGGALETRRFIKADAVPSNFPYTITTYTGYGGVLLVGDIYGNPIAYDLACPVECRATVRIVVDTENNIAECPNCHSTYDIFTNQGHPLSGDAAKKGYGLQCYTVSRGASDYYIISR